jgi:hypothetical protein
MIEILGKDYGVISHYINPITGTTMKVNLLYDRGSK